MEKSKKNAVGLVKVLMLFVGANKLENKDSNARIAVFFIPETILNND